MMDSDLSGFKSTLAWWDTLANRNWQIEVALDGDQRHVLEILPGTTLLDALDLIGSLVEESSAPDSYGVQWDLRAEGGTDSLAVCQVSLRLPAVFFFIVSREWRLTVLRT